MYPDKRQLLGALRALAVAGLLSLALGVSACGDSDDEPQDPAKVADGQAAPDSPKGGGQPEGGGSTGGPALTGDVEQARAGASSVEDIYESFAAAVDAGVAAIDVPAGNTLEAAEGNGGLTKVCDLMSEQAQRQTIVYAKRSAGLADVEWTCEKATALLLRRSRQAGTLGKSLRAKIVGVNAEGDRATASVRFSGKGPIATIRLVKEGGRWKLAASPSSR